MSNKFSVLIILNLILFILIGCVESDTADVVIHLQQNHLLNSRSIAPENKEIAYYKISGFGPKGANFVICTLKVGLCLHSLQLVNGNLKYRL